jgi:uncharacterized protein
MPTLRTITPVTARRLAIARQRLAGPRPKSDAAGLLDVFRDLGCVQLDPISVVARSHQLVLWSRVGAFAPAQLETLLWRERRIFEYWAHAASLVLMDDFPLHAVRMQAYRQSGASVWLAENAVLHAHILAELAAHGPLGSSAFEDRSQTAWYSSGWTSGRTVSQMLQALWVRGEILVSARKGATRLWDLAERVVPPGIEREPMPVRDATRLAATRSLRALGVARMSHIRQHFVRGRYPDLPAVLGEMHNEGVIHRIQIMEDGNAWPDTWYIHADDLGLLDAIESGAWQPRTVLLSPFDNLICDRARTEQMFGFAFRTQIYVPKTTRAYGYYLMPILYGDRLIGRIDPRLDRKAQRLIINAIHYEPGIKATKPIQNAVAAIIADLATFVGAKDIALPELPVAHKG